MKSALGFLLGFLLLAPLLSLLPNHFFVRSPGSLTELNIYQAYDPVNEDKDKYFVISNCNLINASVGNDRANGNLGVSHTAANYSEVANFYLRRSQANNVRFFDFGHGGSTFSEHLIYAYHALHMSHPKAVILTNAFFPFLYMKRPGELIETVGALEKIEREYPSTQPDVNTLIDYYSGTDEFRLEEKEFGRDWRAHIAPDTLTLSKSYYARQFLLNHTALSRLKHPFDNRLWNPLNLRNYYRELKVDEVLNFYVRWFFRPGLSLEHWVLDKLSNARADEDREWDKLVEDNLNWVASQYNAPNANNPIDGLYQKKNLEQLEDAEAPIRVAFFRVLAQMATATNVQFIYYLPPRLDMQDSYYHRLYVPRVLDRMEKIAKQENFMIINQTNDHDLTPLDYMTTVDDLTQNSAALVNIVGNFKRVSLLLHRMNDDHLLSLPAGSTDSHVWQGWARLPRDPVLKRIAN